MLYLMSLIIYGFHAAHNTCNLNLLHTIYASLTKQHHHSSHIAKIVIHIPNLIVHS